MDGSAQKIAELARKMDALNLWPVVGAFHWALKSKGSILPYFTCVVRDATNRGVRHRLALLEGWQTFHDFVQIRTDPNYGFISTPMELPHFELIFPVDGRDAILIRNDPGYAPVPASEQQCAFVEPMLWQCYGVMLRIEADRSLALKFAGEKSVFARIEEKPGEWVDAPLTIPPGRGHTETIQLVKDDLDKAKDLPMVADEVIDVQFETMLGVQTTEPRPRLVYRLTGENARNAALLFDQRFSIHPEFGLRGIWEQIPRNVLACMIKTGHLPGEVRVSSGRLFRVLRHLCNEIPFRMSLHDKLERLSK